MRTRFLTLLCCSLLCSAYPQQLRWAVNIGFQAKSIVGDQFGRIYALQGYPSGHAAPPGTIVYKFSSSGQLRDSIWWDQPVYLNRLLCDGTKGLFFCGTYSGSVSFGGISLPAHGQLDGVVGHMDFDGTVDWVKDLGGAGNDAINDITLSDDGQTIAFTGAMEQTVYSGQSVLAASQPPSILVATADVNGNITKFKLHDFLTSRQDKNSGLEIKFAGSSLMVLADCEGRPWPETSDPTPEQGRYLFRFSEQMVPAWYKLIISPGCYYGYSCAGLSWANGYAYLPRYCSGKYGGDGELLRIGEGGEILWSKPEQDGGYSMTCSDGRKLYYGATEDANGCPCPSNDLGKGAVRAIDEDGNDLLLFKSHACHFWSVSRGLDETVLAAGLLMNDTSIAGARLQRGNLLLAFGGNPAAVSNHAGDSGIRVFPNPSPRAVHIESSRAIDRIDVYDISGRLVETAAPGQTTYRSADLRPGLYLVEIRSGSTAAAVRVIVTE